MLLTIIPERLASKSVVVGDAGESDGLADIPAGKE
jgi:hypothetical protein